ncbi:MAG: sugar phosphate nucleotidyltransferase [Candidatus Izemoplasmatales bacterium]
MKKIIAMILVGGRGTRLGDITKKIAKPAVSFGAKYRLIDFTLSNISNSNISTVGIVTQYEPFELMNYIGSGASWDLDYIDGGVRFLTPYSQSGDVLWQKGTAHAIKQYYRFIKDQSADYVLILSGDHIYKMDYNQMLETHISRKADLTIAATNVPTKEASRFGILDIDEQLKLKNFYEKPKSPVSSLASMGIYIFSVGVLEELFFHSSEEDLVDFGKDIIPHCLKMKKDISVHIFEDYWRDVGTIDSLYDANMDLLENSEFLGLNSSKNMPIFSKSLNLPPHMVLKTGSVKSSVIADGCSISGSVYHSTIAYNVKIGKDSVVDNCVVLPSVTIGKNVYIKNAIINQGLEIPNNFYFLGAKTTLITSDNLYEVGEIR